MVGRVLLVPGIEATPGMTPGLIESGMCGEI